MPKSERSFRYQERSKEDVRARANMRGGNFDSFIKPAYKMFKVKDGKNVVRILPPTWEKPKHYGYDIFVNYEIGADNQSYLSLSKMKSQKDPIAEARQAAEREGEEELAKKLRPNQRILMWVIDRNNEDEGPLLWAAPFTVDKAFANLAFDEDTNEVIFIDDHNKGCDVRFYKEGTGMLTKYDASKMKLLTAGPISQDEKLQDEWLEYITENPIPDCLQFYSYDHIAAVFNGKGPEEDEAAHKAPGKAEPDDDEAPPPRRARPRVAEPDHDPETGEVDEKPQRRRAPSDDDDTPPASESIRDRIRRRRAEAAPDEDE